MKRWSLLVLLLASVGCSNGSDAQQDSPVDEAAIEKVVEALARGEVGEPTDNERNACKVLEAATDAESLGVEASAIQYRPANLGRVIKHALCTAWWDRPDKEALEAGYVKALTERLTGPQEERGEQPKLPRLTNEISLTLVHPTYDTPEEAVTSLEGAVAQLTEGITTNIGGKERTTRVDFDDWLPGIGDRATWSPKQSELHVAAKGIRFALSVRVFDDSEQNQRYAIEMAQRVIDAL